MLSSPLIRAVQRLLALGREQRALLLRSLVGMICVGLGTGAYAWLLGPALHFLLTGGTSKLGALARFFPGIADLPRAELLLALPIAVVVVGLIKGIGYLIQFFYVGLYGQHVVLALRRRIFVRLLGLSPAQLAGQKVGDLLSRFTADVAAVETAATNTLASWLRDSLSILILAGTCFALSWRLSLILLLAVPLAVIPAGRLTRRLLARQREGLVSAGGLAAQLQEGLGAVRTLKAFVAESTELRRFDARAEVLQHTMSRAAWMRAAVPALMEVLASAAIAATLGFAASSQAVPPDTLVSFIAAVILLYQPAKDLGRVSQLALSASAALDRVDAVLELQAAVRERDGAQTLAALREPIQFRDVRFAWDAQPTLDGISFDIPLGQTTALVGGSGGGKSTLTALLLRLVDLQDGSVTFNGVDARDLTTASVRSRFALVTQDALVFSASIADNLRIAKPGAALAELRKACEIAFADGFISALPHGYDTLLGERGVNLSGGQKQRLCLARALLADADVLVLDEATSSLDAQGEAEVQAALDAVLPGRTAVVIAHRLSTVQRAARIHVLDAGRIIESGTHAELLERDGRYAQLWRAQRGGA